MGQVFMFPGDDPQMIQAYAAAQATFKTFWREMSWERRRIIPAFGLSMIKLPFTDGERNDDNPDYEHMWVGDVDFDGETLSGTLMNQPNWLKSVKEGDTVRAPFSHLEDWLLTSGDKVYGAFTVHAMRLAMDPRERKGHDEAWGLDFGDPHTPRVQMYRPAQAKKKKSFLGIFGGKKEEDAAPTTVDGHEEHPMCINMIPSLETELAKGDAMLTYRDENGYGMLHSEALAGNYSVVKVLVKHGANPKEKAPNGQDPVSLSKVFGYDVITRFLETA